jgi:hypothetical protein
MRQVSLAVILACVLSGTAWAGEIPSGDRPTPHGSSSPVTPAEIPADDGTGEIIPTSDETAPEASSTLLTIILALLTIGR